MAIEELITLLLTTTLVGITGYYARVTHKMLKIMQQQSEAVTRPYLTINVFSEPHGVLYYLRIANTGRTGASNVRLTLDRDFYQLGEKHMPNLREASVFQQPIEQLPPGAEIIFGLAPAHVVLDDKADQSVAPQIFSINATYLYGEKHVSEMTTIDFRPYKESMHPPSVIADELQEIRKQLEKIAVSPNRKQREL